MNKKAIREATKRLSMDGVFWFTARNLYYELVRRDAIAPPAGDPRAELVQFRRDLKVFEREHAPIQGLVRAGPARRAAPSRDLPDVFDYAVRRVLVFDRLETCLLFAMNGFHRRIETALVSFPDFPAHVWKRIELQAERGPNTALYTVADASRRGARLRKRLRKHIQGEVRIADVGLSFGQAFTLGITVRARPSSKPPREDLEHEALLLATGNYAHLEELPPLELMRWVYSRIARGPGDPGFG